MLSPPEPSWNLVSVHWSIWYYLPPPIEWEPHKGRAFSGLFIPMAQDARQQEPNKCMADIISFCVSTGKVTILAACMSVPAWVRRQRQVRGCGDCARWWRGLEEEGWGGRGRPCAPWEGRAFRGLVAAESSSLPWSKSAKPLLWELQWVREASSWW